MSSNVKIPVLNLLIRSLAAPFTLEGASWIQLLRPAGLIVFFILLSFSGGYIGLGETPRSALALMLWAAQAWFAIEYQKQLLLGPQ
ncbi:MAG: hypothetical protein KJO91_12945, partial [Gammaproteobacteria bacterium]|nr:hypothetical protein [Gammaproteobacteria bacterium]